ncbi:MAG: hypothetical protein QOD00_1360 [Blastocatellia bacterium]|nr:hypothetical protein [Blastocatellia bacterium]
MAGVQMLQQQSRTEVSPVVRRKSSPAVATLLSLVCPGLGAAYNGQTSKALVHFAIFASFFQMAIVTDGSMPFFIFGFIGTWLYAAVDACRTSQLMRSGLAPEAVEDAIARRLYGNPLAWSVTLIVLGTLFLLHTLLGIQLPVRQFLPVALVALGGYMLYDYITRRLKGERGMPAFDARQPPPSVVSAPLDSPAFRTGELVTQVTARDGGR